MRVSKLTIRANSISAIGVVLIHAKPQRSPAKSMYDHKFLLPVGRTGELNVMCM